MDRSDDSFKDMAKIAEAWVNAFEEQNAQIEAREAKLKEELRASQDSIRVEAQVAKKDKKIKKDMGYIAWLESKLAKATSKGMVLES